MNPNIAITAVSGAIFAAAADSLIVLGLVIALCALMIAMDDDKEEA